MSVSGSVQFQFFLQPNKSEVNLINLSSPKLFATPAVSILTKDVYNKTPHFKPTPKNIFNATLGVSLVLTIGAIALQSMNNTVRCAATRDWMNHFFGVSSECFVNSFQTMTEPRILLFHFLGISILGFGGLASYLPLRWYFRDTQEPERIRLLHKEYDMVSRTLSHAYESAKNDEIRLNRIKHMTRRLAVNLPIIRGAIHHIAKIDLKDAEAITAALSMTIHRILEEKPR